MVNRITGFSGFDVDTTVQKLMQAQKVPLDRLKQKKQVLEWQRDDFRTLNSKILDLRNTAFNMKLQGPYLAKKSSSDQESIVTVKGTNNAIDGNYNIEIKQLATAATMDSGTVGAKSQKGMGTTLESLGLNQNEALTIAGEKGTVTIKVNKTDTIGTLVSNINAQSSKTGVRVNYDESMDKFFFSSTATGSQAKVDLRSTMNDTSGTPKKLLDDILKLSGGANVPTSITTNTRQFKEGTGTFVNPDLKSEQKFTISYNGKTSEIKLDVNTTIGQVITNINTSDVGKQGVSAYLDDNNNLVIVNPDRTKGAVSFAESDTDNVSILNSSGLGLLKDDGTSLLSVDLTYRKMISDASTGSAKDAIISFNNNPDVTYSTNTFNINGIEFTAKKAQVGTKVGITVSQDTDAIFNSVKSLIDKYNDTLTELNKKANEDRYRDFAPLTEDQRNAMKEDQIQKWEEKAKSGLLKNDTILTSGINSFRFNVTSSVGGLSANDLKQLSEIGIATSADYTQKGKLVIDEATLRKAIAEKPEQVMNLFTAKDDTQNDATHGIAVRLYDVADRMIGTIRQKAGNSLSGSQDYDIGKNLDRLNKQIDSMNRKLADIENRYYKQFSAMEAAMNKYSSQSSYFANMFNSN